MKPGKAYVLPTGSPLGSGWQEIGYISEDGLPFSTQPVGEIRPVFAAGPGTLVSFSKTFTIRHRSYLEHREFIRLMAGNTVRLPSLIHHGKKRPRNHTGRRRYQ